MVMLAPARQAAAQAITAEETAKIDTIRQKVTRIEKERDQQAESFNGLLTLRDQLDPIREDLREVVSALQERLAAAQAQLAEFGAAAEKTDTPEAQKRTAERNDKQALVNAIDGHFRSARALQVHIDQLWDSITDMRRNLFNRRIFQHEDSILSPEFWGRVVSVSLPDFYWRSFFKLQDIDASIERKKGWPILLGIAVFSLLVGAGLIWLHIWLARRRASAAPDDAAAPAKAAIVAHAAIVLTMRTLPFAAIALVLVIAVTRFDIVPSEAQTFLVGLAGAILIYGIGNGVTRAVFTPGTPAYRIIRTDNPTARRAVLVFDAMLFTYLAGLTVLGFAQMLSAQLSLTIAATGIFASLVVIVGAAMLLRQSEAELESPVHGLVQAPIHLLRPIFWLLAILITGALAFGFIAFAGFLIGRTLATAIILCFAILIYLAADTIFLEALAPERPANRRIADMFGLKPSMVDLAGTIIAGTLRVFTIIFTVLILFSPWGIEFGNVNPFEDVFFGVRFGDIRGLIGAAGIALILFTFGLLATRLFVSWLDQQLLPRTALNTGVRHSITTISGYLGFLVATTIALSQAGVQLQNIALVASALSVGIGFGLQQIVSNFVAGLIVLAERPIRVGDVIVVRGEEGKVQRINVRATELSLGENSTVIVPNSDIVSSIVKNRSFDDPTHRASLRLVLVHDSDLKLAFDILLRLSRAHKNVLGKPSPKVYITNVADNGIEIELQVICDRIANMSNVRSDLYYNVLGEFRLKGLRIAGSPPPPPVEA